MTEKQDEVGGTIKGYQETCENCGMDLQVALDMAKRFLRAKTFPETNPYWKNFKECLEKGGCPCKKFKAKNHSPRNKSGSENLPEDTPSESGARIKEGTHSLSDEREPTGFGSYYYYEDQVKNFIKKLKDLFDESRSDERYNKLFRKIDKLAGDKLT